MVKNNFEYDVKVKCIEKGITQQDLGESIGTTGQYINRLMKKETIVNRTFIKMFEALGYDVVITYEPKKGRVL